MGKKKQKKAAEKLQKIRLKHLQRFQEIQCSGKACKSKCCKKYKKCEEKRCKRCPCKDLLKKSDFVLELERVA